MAAGHQQRRAQGRSGAQGAGTAGAAAMDDETIRQRCRRMQDLCARFPCLRGVPRAAPWDPVALDAYAVGPAASAMAKTVIAFVLALWCGTRDAYLAGRALRCPAGGGGVGCGASTGVRGVVGGA